MSKREKITSEQKENPKEQKGNSNANKTSLYLYNKPTEVSATRYLSHVESIQLLATLLGEYPPKNLVI